MPLHYEIDPALQAVIITGDYAESGAWRTLLSAVASDPLYRKGFNFIRDLRGSAHPVDAAAVVGIINVVRQYWSVLGARRAAIVMGAHDSDPALIAHALADGHELPIRAFASYADAVEWLSEP